MVTRTISAMPFLGGTFNQNGLQQAMVRLTPSRMVWVYSQTNPNWIICSVIDTQGGYTSANMPVATTQQLTIQGTLNTSSYVTNAVRLTDSTFMIISSVYFLNSSNNLPTYYWICSIDNTNTISVVDSGTYNFATTNNYQITPNQSNHTTTFVELADNLISVHHQPPSNTNWYYYNLVVNPTTGKLVPPVLGDLKSVAGGLTSNTNADWHISKIPDRPQYTMITRRYGLGGPYVMNGSTSLIMDNTGAIYMQPNQLPQNAPNMSTATGYADMVPMQNDRLLISGVKDATVYAIDYSAKTWRQISTSQFSTLTSPDTYGRYVIPLNADYWFMASRQHFWVPGTTPLMRCKVVRRVDSQLIEQSAASSANTGNGFTITTAPTTFINWQGQYPELVNGKIFYWGFDANPSGNVLKLSWSVLSLPAS